MSASRSLTSKGFITLMLILQIAVYFVVYADIPIARMTVCFFYLMFIPGFAILKLLSLKNLNVSEKVLFSVGLSISFLMFAGAAINEIAKLAFSSPLSLNLLIISINTVILLISFMGARRDGLDLGSALQLKDLKLPLLVLLSISILLLGSYGITVVNVSGNSFLLLILILAISIIISSVFISEKVIPSKYYPLILFVVCICLVFFIGSSTAWITKYLTGNGDQWIEYYAFKLTEGHNFWNSGLAPSPYVPVLFPTYSMLSVTILPTVFSVITGMDSSSLFKLLYPLVVAFMAIGAYKLYQTQIDKKEAFLATIFLITVSVGKGWGSSKQMIAQLFYVLLFFLLFRKDISQSKKIILFMLFCSGLVVSHYSLTYLFLFALLSAFLILVVRNFGKTTRFPLYKIPLAFVLIAAVITFSWYIFVNKSATFTLLGDTFNTVVSNLGQFFNPESRGTALIGLGVFQPTSIFNSISSFFFILTELLIVLGFVKLITNRKKTRFSLEYTVIAALNLAIIAINVILPSMADTFLMSRFYQTTLVILAPLAILGGKAIVELIPKPKFRKLYVPLLAFLVFIPLLLFQIGFVYEVTKVPSESLTLSGYRWNENDLYAYTTNVQEVAGAQWIQKYDNVTEIIIHSDGSSRANVLTAYGMIGRGRILYLTNATKLTLNDLIYLASTDLISRGYIFSATEISPLLEDQNIIYSNGDCEIYEVPTS